jgi:hypothetical protein
MSRDDLVDEIQIAPNKQKQKAAYQEQVER